MKDLKELIFRHLAVLLFFSLTRVVFLFWNYDFFIDASFSTLLLAFAWGLRFDTSLIALANVPLILVWILPNPLANNSVYQRIWLLLFVIWNSFLLLINLIDTEFFAISKRRLTHDVFLDGKQDLLQQIPQFFVNYFYFLLATIFIGLVLWKFFDRRRPLFSTFSLKYFFLRLLLLVPASLLIILAVRGGLLVKPLHPSHALAVGHGPSSALALNAPFSILRHRKSQQIPRLHFFESPQEAYKQILAHDERIGTQAGWGKDLNVIIIILESFSTEYTQLGGGTSYTPFLDKLMNNGLVFEEHYANGSESIHALPALLAGIPHLTRHSYVRSPYATNPMRGAGHLAKESGRESAFFHGGQNGTMGFDAFIRLAGFDKYFGLDQYPHREQYDGVWGIPDHLYLPWVAQQIEKMQEPFLASLFTLSSHQPYYIPEEFVGRFPKGELRIHESIGYSDEALRSFFKEAEKAAWFKNTLFIITSDHTQRCHIQRFCHRHNRFRVPLIFYAPHLKFPEAHLQKVTQHVDVLWTLADAWNSNTRNLPPFGQSVFRTDPNGGEALLHIHSNYSLVQGPYNIFSLDDEFQGLFHTHKDWQSQNPLNNVLLQNQLIQKKRAYRQIFHEGLIQGTWHFE
jgi:phosphoglycerol transferase MdoB-like AlkP superfamily enzyme